MPLKITKEGAGLPDSCFPIIRLHISPMFWQCFPFNLIAHSSTWILQWTFLNFPPFSVFLGIFHVLKCEFLIFRDFQFSCQWEAEEKWVGGRLCIGFSCGWWIFRIWNICGWRLLVFYVLSLSKLRDFWVVKTSKYVIHSLCRQCWV